jgi:hypothetical protein
MTTLKPAVTLPFVICALVCWGCAPDTGSHTVKSHMMSIDSNAAYDDFDRLLGESADTGGVVRGPRIRVEGVATLSRQLTDSFLTGDGPEPFSIMLRNITWPDNIVGRRVIVEGRVLRQWHSGVQTVRTSSWPFDPGVQNRLAGIGTGFGYYLEDSTFALVGDDAGK